MKKVIREKSAKWTIRIDEFSQHLEYELQYYLTGRMDVIGTASIKKS